MLFVFRFEGIWELERWFRFFDIFRGNFFFMVGDKKRFLDLDRDYINRRRLSGKVVFWFCFVEWKIRDYICL